jgi:hypothetical protein
MSDEPATMFFQSSAASGHEKYFTELAALLRASDGPPDPTAVAELRARYDMDQITELDNNRHR